MLTLPQLKDVCLYFQHSKQCRYLKQDDSDYNKWYCLKLKPQEKNMIDKKLSETVAKDKANRIDPKKQGYPLGDNCGGYPLLKFVNQGYDLDSKGKP
jgi:hypothetical protein